MKEFLIRWKQKDKYYEFDRETKVRAIDENTAKAVFFKNFHSHKTIEIVEVLEIMEGETNDERK